MHGCHYIAHKHPNMMYGQLYIAHKHPNMMKTGGYLAHGNPWGVGFRFQTPTRSALALLAIALNCGLELKPTR